MQEIRTKVASAVGLHARPAALFSSRAKKSGCTVRLAKLSEGIASNFVDGASVLRVMTLGVKCGDEILIQIEGEHEVQTAIDLREIVESTEH